MELRVYLQLLLKKWWIVLPTFLVTFTTGLVLTYTQTPIYSTMATFVVVPSSVLNSDGNDFARGLDILGRREEIAQTFTEIASSRHTKKQALSSLSLESSEGYSISSKLRPLTNVIELTVQGPDPIIVRDLANAAGTVTEEYIQGLYEVFIILPLDQATTPRNPISPKYTLNLILAVVLGLALGVGMAALSEYLETPSHSTVSVNIIDEKTGVYNITYLLQRLGEEMIRAKRNRYPLSLALIRFKNLDLLKGNGSDKARAEFLHQAAMVINQSLREEDIVAPFKEDIFAILLPDMTGENARATMEYIQTLIAWTPFQLPNNNKFNLKGVVGVVTYDRNGTSRDELVAEAYQALQLAEVDHKGKSYLINDPNLVTEHDN